MLILKYWTIPLKAKNDPELAPMVVKAETGQPGVNSPLLKDRHEKDQGMLLKEILTVVFNNKQKLSALFVHCTV